MCMMTIVVLWPEMKEAMEISISILAISATCRAMISRLDHEKRKNYLDNGRDINTW